VLSRLWLRCQSRRGPVTSARLMRSGNTQPERLDRGMDGGKSVGPVVSIPGEQADGAALDGDQQAIAVELDLADPIALLGRMLHKGAELRWLHERHATADGVRGGFPPKHGDLMRRGGAAG
jgi:hypothetical protein